MKEAHMSGEKTEVPAGGLYNALAKAQGEFGAVTKDAKANLGTFDFRYATLDSVLKTVRPVLAKHGLALTQTFEGTDLVTRLHLGDQFAESRMSMPVVPDWKARGAAVTYARRYSLVALLGLATEDDGDVQGLDGVPAKAPQAVYGVGGDGLVVLRTDGSNRHKGVYKALYEHLKALPKEEREAAFDRNVEALAGMPDAGVQALRDLAGGGS